MRWPGYLSTSAGVKFEDLPNGIGAWAAMPDAGKFQVHPWWPLKWFFTLSESGFWLDQR